MESGKCDVQSLKQKQDMGDKKWENENQEVESVKIDSGMRKCGTGRYKV